MVAANPLRFHPKLAQAIAIAMADFDDPRVGQILDRFVTNREMRQEVEQSIRKRLAEWKQQ